jgi:ABC-type uncharacterized transport system permease subunit
MAYVWIGLFMLKDSKYSLEDLFNIFRGCFVGSRDASIEISLFRDDALKGGAIPLLSHCHFNFNSLSIRNGKGVRFKCKTLI